MLTTCLDDETVTTYLRGNIEPQESRQCGAHIAECPACRLRVEKISGMLDELRRIPLFLDDPAISEEISPPELIKLRINSHSRNWEPFCLVTRRRKRARAKSDSSISDQGVQKS